KNAALQVRHEWNTRLENENAVDLPSAQNHVERTIPIVPQQLAFAERQLIGEVHYASMSNVTGRHRSLEPDVVIRLDRRLAAEPRLPAGRQRVVVDHLR